MSISSELTHEEVAEIAQLHENFLTELESLAIASIASGDWSQFEQFVNDFRVSQDVQEVSTAENLIKDLWNLAFQEPKCPKQRESNCLSGKGLTQKRRV
jgi:hypothetical protein